MEFKEIVNSRYATKKFTGEKLSEEKIEALKDLIKLSASSYGLQPYKIQVISDSEIKEKLKPASYNQEQITTCSHLFVFYANKDVMGQIDKMEAKMKEAGKDEESFKGYTDMMRNFVQGMTEEKLICWAQKQAYIALGNGINGAKALGFDSCPMEGFDPKQYAEILSPSEELVPSVIMPVGIAADEARPKSRYEDLFI